MGTRVKMKTCGSIRVSERTLQIQFARSSHAQIFFLMLEITTMTMMRYSTICWNTPTPRAVRAYSILPEMVTGLMDWIILLKVPQHSCRQEIHSGCLCGELFSRHISSPKLLLGALYPCLHLV